MKSATFAIFVAAALLLAGCASAPLNEGVDAQGRAYRGAGNAKLTIYEYSDFECPFCGEAQPTLNDIIHQYSSNVRLEYRYFPLSIHPHSMNASLAAVCADNQGKFWAMYDKLFANQNALEYSDLLNYANQIGLNQTQFTACFASDSAAQAVQKDIQNATALGVQATPTFIIGESTVRGAQSADVFRSAIDNELAKIPS
jgi:protein-disulfide isomerase